MKYLLPILTIIFLSGAPVVLAHETGEAHEEPTALAKREGNISPTAVGVFGVAIAGAGGYFLWLKMKKGKEPPKSDSQPKA